MYLRCISIAHCIVWVNHQSIYWISQDFFLRNWKMFLQMTMLHISDFKLQNHSHWKNLNVNIEKLIWNFVMYVIDRFEESSLTTHWFLMSEKKTSSRVEWQSLKLWICIVCNKKGKYKICILKFGKLLHIHYLLCTIY